MERQAMTDLAKDLVEAFWCNRSQVSDLNRSDFLVRKQESRGFLGRRKNDVFLCQSQEDGERRSFSVDEMFAAVQAFVVNLQREQLHTH